LMMLNFKPRRIDVGSRQKISCLQTSVNPALHGFSMSVGII